MMINKPLYKIKKNLYNESMIDTTTFEAAIETLDEIIERYDRESHDNAIRDALIQRFEYTYSLAIKVLMRYIKYNLAELDDELTFNETIRNANKLGLLKSNLEKWTIYRQKRNLSSHTYNEEAAMEVVKVTKEFQEEVHYLLERLNKKKW